MNEDNRQIFHLALGFAVLVLVALLGIKSALVLFSAIFLFGLVLANYKVLGGKIKVVDWFLDAFDRVEEIPAKGAMFYVAGMLLVLTFARPLEFAFALIALHAAGDAFATIVGRRFARGWRLPWNSAKTYPGVFAFIITGAAAAWVFLPFASAFAYAVFLGIVESLPFKFDDNLTVPIAGLALKFGAGL